jgi:hypothetical protein
MDWVIRIKNTSIPAFWEHCTELPRRYDSQEEALAAIVSYSQYAGEAGFHYPTSDFKAMRQHLPQGSPKERMRYRFQRLRLARDCGLHFTPEKLWEVFEVDRDSWSTEYRILTLELRSILSKTAQE